MDSQESLILFSQETYEVMLSQGTQDLLGDVMVSSDGGMDDGTHSSRQPLNDETCFSNYAGPHNFQVKFRPEEDHIKKSCAWTYSKQLDKLYMRMDQLCPFLASVSSAPPQGSVIRAALYFKKEEHFAEIPQRCRTHSNFGSENREHLIQSDLSTATYEFFPSGRSCVKVPLALTGSQCSVVNLKIMCQNSCEGGLGRRPTVIVLTLENNGEVLGKFSLEVRVCSCPGRDRDTHERKELDRNGSNINHTNLGQDIKRAAHSVSNVTQNISGKRMRTDYEITTTSKRAYRILNGLKEILEKQTL